MKSWPNSEGNSFHNSLKNIRSLSLAYFPYFIKKNRLMARLASRTVSVRVFPPIISHPTEGVSRNFVIFMPQHTPTHQISYHQEYQHDGLTNFRAGATPAPLLT
jgi:hypothetical protein